MRGPRKKSTAKREATALLIVAFGASSTAVDDWTGQSIEMYPELLPGALDACGITALIHNAGIGGGATREARERLDRDARSHWLPGYDSRAGILFAQDGSVYGPSST